MARGDENIGPCKLCLEQASLKYSHILPEFLYEGVYDVKHKTIALDPRPNSRDRILQKGLREYLFCGECETHLSGYETYAANILRSLPDTSSCKPGDIVWKCGVDYKKFKIFQMSLLWRCGIALKSTFQDVELGPHEEKVRSLIKDSDPSDPWVYGCIMSAFLGSGPPIGMVKFPGRLRIEGHIAYNFVALGLFWLFIVSSHSNRFYGKGSFLSIDGKLPLHISSKTPEEFLKGLARKLEIAGKQV